MSNLLVAGVSFGLFVLVVLAAARLGRVYLFGLSIAFILVSNITVQMAVEIVPGVEISWAIIIYSLVYLITDLVIEFYGRSAAYWLAATNLAVQLLLWTYVWLSLQVVPASSGTSTQVYETMRLLFGTTSQITIAAVLASVGPFLDITTTSLIRNYLKHRKIVGGTIANLILRAKLSTFIGEVINTVVFFSIALMGTGLPWSSRVSIIVSATVAKWVISAADAPFVWLFFKFVGPPKDASGELVAELEVGRRPAARS